MLGSGVNQAPAAATDPVRAYSYTRFSTPGQLQGDSLRRQLSLTRAWCEARGVELVEDYRDLGVSAYRGRNAVQGKLAAFLAAVESGEIPRGSVLIVESLDRITRTELSDALALFLRLINGGVTVVTLADGKEYKRATINESMGDLMMSLVILSRANEESRMKSQRIAASWKARRMAAESGTVKPSRQGAPTWLTIANGKWAFIPERAKAVRLIFKLATKGYTLRQIGDTLSKQGMPSFQAKRVWQTPSIVRIIRTRAAVGELILKQPGERDVVLPGYYPATVTEAEWTAANAMFAGIKRVSGRTREGNIFRGLVFNADGDPAHVDRQFRHGKWYEHIRFFVRATAKQASSGWKPDILSDIIVGTLPEATRVLSALPVREGKSTVEAIARNLADADARIGNLVQAIANGYSAALDAALRRLEGERAELETKLAAARLAEGAGQTPLAQWKPVPGNDPARLAAHLRTVLSRVVLVDRETVRVELRAGFSYVARVTEAGVEIEMPKATLERRA